MDTIKKQILNGFKKIGEFVDNCIHKANQKALEKQELQQKQRQEMQKQQQQDMAMAIMSAIANDMYEALGGVTYPNLKTINTAMDIRPFRYGSNRNGKMGYTYKLQKNTDDKLAPHQCNTIRKYINTDIHRACVTLISTYGLEFGFDYVQTYFPYVLISVTQALWMSVFIYFLIVLH